MVAEGVTGREAELEEVDRFLGGEADAVVALAITGEAGIGKTTVWRAALAGAADRGACVLSCRPSAAEAKFAFAGLADLLEPVEQAPFELLPDPQREALEVALLRSGPGGRAQVPRAAAAALLSLVRSLADSRPVVLAVDDVQWLDVPSRRVLEFVARRLGPEPVRLVYSLRTPATADALAAAVGEDALRRLSLGPLSLAALSKVVSARVELALPRPLMVRIRQASAGNPFYAIEIARLLAERGGAPARAWELPVPDDLRALTASRVRGLPDRAREALLLVATLGQGNSATVDLDALAPAEEAGFVTIDSGGRVEFAHPLFASALVGDLTSLRRRELHMRAAGVVSDPEQRARHLALGSAEPSTGVAVQLDGAAARAADRGAPEAAAELAELAAEHTAPNDLSARGERLLHAAHWHFDAGDLTRAEALARDTHAVGSPGPIQAQALALSAQLQGRRNDFAQAGELAGAALAVAGDDVGLRAAIELDLAYYSTALGDFVAGERYAGTGLVHAEAAEDLGSQADALATQTMTRFLCGRGLAEGSLDRAVALEDLDPGHERAFVMRPRYIRALLWLWTGRLKDAISELEALHGELVQRGHGGSVPLLLLYLVWGYLWQGDLGSAARFAAEARDAAGLLEDPTTVAIGLAAIALVCAHNGESELARAEAGRALDEFERLRWRSGVIWPCWALGLVGLAEDDPAGVDAILGPLADALGAMGAGDPVLRVFLPDEIEALIALGELERAEAHLEPFHRSALALDRAWAVAAADRCRGALDGARGNAEAAFSAFERALRAHDQAGMPFERARTLLVAGQGYRRFKRRARARAAFTEALEIFERVGTPLWADRTRAALARVGGPGTRSDELTETELRLAQLAAAGLSNRQVAERAFVSVKTVEANLTRAYRKLGVRSRVGLANALRGTDDITGPRA